MTAIGRPLPEANHLVVDLPAIDPCVSIRRSLRLQRHRHGRLISESCRPSQAGSRGHRYHRDRRPIWLLVGASEQVRRNYTTRGPKSEETITHPLAVLEPRLAIITGIIDIQKITS